LLLSEQCRVKLTLTRRAVKLTAGRVKSQGGVVDIEDVITSLFLKPTACRLPVFSGFINRIADKLQQLTVKSQGVYFLDTVYNYIRSVCSK